MLKSSEAALPPYRQLQSLVSSLAPLQDAAEGAAPHLLDHVTKTSQNLRRQIKDSFAAELESVLKKLYWPKEGITLPVSLQRDWNDSVNRLLDLQVQELEAIEDASVSGTAFKAPTVLLPLEILVQPLEMRFRYHFEGNRPTNRVDRPEWFLSHVVDLLSTCNDFVVDKLQPNLANCFRNTNMALNLAYVDSTSAFITALLPMLRSKISSTIAQVSNQPQLLSHLIHEVMTFDTTIRDEWGYSGGRGLEGWNGLAWEVLVLQDWFERWLQVEKDCMFDLFSFDVDLYTDVSQSHYQDITA